MAKRTYKKEVVHRLDDSAKEAPNAKEFEPAVLGALMIDKDAYAQVSEILTEETFYDPRHGMIYGAIKSLAVRDLPLDVLCVTEELAREGRLEEVGGPGYIAELSSRVASSAHIEYHSKVLAQKKMARDLILIAQTLKDKAFDETEDVDETKEEAEKKLFDLGQKGLAKEEVRLITSLNISIKMIQAAASHPDGITGVPSGYEKVDNILAGFQPSDLIILAGRPAMGKTALAVCLAWNIAKRDIPVAFFSLEMSHPQLTNRIISNVCSIPGDKILRGTLNPGEWSVLDKAVNNMDRPLYIDDTPGLTTYQLRSKARYLVRTKGVKIIFVDYLQLMNVPEGDYSSKQEKVAIISSELKSLAKELNVPVVALSQLNRGIESREGLEGKRPQLSDLRESGAIEQDADVVMFVHRPEYYHIYQDDNGHDLHGVAQIIIAKHRKGAIGDVNLKFIAEYLRFEEPESLSSSFPPTSFTSNPRVKF